jgi:hypothetical protein
MPQATSQVANNTLYLLAVREYEEYTDPLTVIDNKYVYNKN